jgi:hypothetical protein
MSTTKHGLHSAYQPGGPRPPQPERADEIELRPLSGTVARGVGRRGISVGSGTAIDISNQPP